MIIGSTPFRRRDLVLVVMGLIMLLLSSYPERIGSQGGKMEIARYTAVLSEKTTSRAHS